MGPFFALDISVWGKLKVLIRQFDAHNVDYIAVAILVI